VRHDYFDEKNRRQQQYIDPKGYWIDPVRNVRRMGGKQEVTMSATEIDSDLNGPTFSTL
jgi:hypothetical protein